MKRLLKVTVAALVALAGAAVLAAPNLLINLDATDFDPVGIAWTNNGTLGGTFVPVGNGSGTIAETVEGVPAVTFTMRSRDAMMTNGVSPSAICGKAPWAFEVWVFNPSTDAGAEDVFAWTARNNWPNGADGSCMEFRYGNDVNNAVEHYGNAHNLTWGGAVPTVGQWHHVACTRDAGGTEKLYLDGTIRVITLRSGINLRDDVGFFTLAGVMSKEGNGTFVNVEQTFSGSIARLRIYDGPLTTIELIQNYLAECAEFGIAPEPPPSDQFIWIGTPGMWETWDTPANWLYGSVPTDDGNVTFENKGKAGDYADTRVFKNFAGADGGFGMTNGLVSVQDASNNTRLGIGGGAAFDFRLEGGKFEVQRMPGDAARSMHVGADGGYGEAFIGGGVGPAWLCADQDVAVPYGNMSRGYMEILPGGLVTVSNGNFIVSHGGANPNNATGTVVVAGGTFRHMRNGSVYLGNYNGAQAKLIVNSGSVETPGDIRMSDTANAANVAELFLNGGVTWIRKFSPQNTAVATNIVYLNGGVLRNREGLADFMQGLTAAYVQTGGACFDIIPNIGTVVGVSQPLLDDPSNPGGGLVKTGPGILELRGNNTFTGNIVVEGGCLYLRSAGALPPGGGPGSILLKNGAGISYEVAGGVSALLARIDPASVGTIVLHGANASDEVDLSGHPGLTFGFAGAVTYNPPSGTYTPPASGQHRFSVFGGNNYYDYVISGGDSVVLEANSSPSAYLVLRAGNTFTGGADILGGVLEMQNATALGAPAAPGVRDIGIYNGAALKLNNGVSATLATGIVARIKTDSRGVLLITGNNNGAEYDLTQLPGISISADGGLDYDGTLLTPHPTVGYHLGGGPGGANSDGLKIRNLADGPGGPCGIVVDYPGNPVRLWTNNTFTGGIVVTNGGAVSMRDSTSMGAIPPAPVADHLYISGGFLRPNPDSLDVPYMESHPYHGLTVGEGGMTVYTPANRFFAWRGDLHGTGAITNMDSGAVIFGGAGNTWEGPLILNSNNDDSTFAVGWGNDFSWVKTNVIQGNAMFGVATDLDITWSDAFEKPLGTAPLSVPPSFDTPEGISSSVGLRKLGAGTLTLDMPNTYRRMTRIDSGTLKVGVADAIPWGGSKGNLHVNSNNLFPAGVFDLNGFDVNVNGLNGGGTVSDLTAAGKTLTIGNNNQGGTFFGTVQSPVKLFKTGDGTQTFMNGADVNGLTIQRRTVSAGAETSFGSVTLLNNDDQDTVFSVGDINGLTGEYYWFDFPGLWSLIDTNTLLDIDVFNTFLASYASYHIQSSVSFGDTFDTGWTGGGAPGSKFQNGFNGRSNFYGRWTGEFYAEEDGVYEFATASDDGSVVYVNCELVVSNSRSQSYNINDKRSGTIELTKGWHDILIGYLQQTGERGLTVFMTPPGGEEDPLPQSLLRPYPVTLGALSGGIPRGRVDILGNSTLAIDSTISSTYTGKLEAVTADARLIKKGAGEFSISGYGAPAFAYTGQVVVAEGTLGLRGAAPFPDPVHIGEGAVLAALPVDDTWGNAGLRCTYYSGNFQDQNMTSLLAMDNHFAVMTPLYFANTTQTGMLAVADSPVFWYQDRVFFPGPYAYDYPPVSEKNNFRIRFQGHFLALEPGDYTFGLRTDDRGDVLVNGERVIENTTSGQPEKTATVWLDAGTHDFQIAWGQGSGGYYVQPRVGVPGGIMQHMPNALLRPSVSTLYGWEGEGALALPSPGSYLRAEIADAQTLDAPMDGAPGAEFEKNGNGTLTLMADNDGFLGTWYVMRGTMVAGDGATSGSLGNAERVHVAAGARLVFDRADDVVFTGRITGGGEICSVGGRVTLCDIGDGFKGTFTSGDFVISGASSVSVESLAQGLDPASVRLEDGARLLVPPSSETPPALMPVAVSNVTLSLQMGLTNAYYLDSMMIQAGGEATIETAGLTGLFGRYYDLVGYNKDTVTAQFGSLSTAIPYLEGLPFICKETTWTAGDVMDFGDNGAQFPEIIRTTKNTNFGAIWQGKVIITDPGEYRFTTRSDDHSMLFIESEIVVNNNGEHGMDTKTGMVTFATSGLYDFSLIYAQGGGGYGLRVEIIPPGEDAFFLPNAMLMADPADLADVSLEGIPSAASATDMPFTLEIGTLGVIDGPGVGTLDITNGGASQNGKLLLNNLFIEAPGAVLAVKGDTALADTNLHVTMGVEPQASSRTLVADFTLTPNYGTLLTGKTTSLDGVPHGKLDYKTGNLYVLRAGGTVLILR